MRTIVINRRSTRPLVSVVLLNSPGAKNRELLDSLSNQSVSRQLYEVLYIKNTHEISKTSREMLMFPCADLLIDLEIPKKIDLYTPLFYNVGIIQSRGEIIIFCTTNFIAKSTFIEQLISNFEENPNIILSINNEMLSRQSAKSCTSRYFLAARRNDLIAIGGADENVDKAGCTEDISEIIARLASAGKIEKRCSAQEFFLKDENTNLINCVETRNQKNTNLRINRIKNGHRIQPIVENSGIRLLRQNSAICFTTALECAVANRVIGRLNLHSPTRKKVKNFFEFKQLICSLKLSFLMIQKIIYHIFHKAQSFSTSLVMKKTFLDHIFIGFSFIQRMSINFWYSIQMCYDILEFVCESNTQEIAIYGSGTLVSILNALVGTMPLKLHGIYTHKTYDQLRGFSGKILTTEWDGSSYFLNELKILGISPQQVISVQ